MGAGWNAQHGHRGESDRTQADGTNRALPRAKVLHEASLLRIRVVLGVWRCQRGRKVVRVHEGNVDHAELAAHRTSSVRQNL